MSVWLHGIPDELKDASSVLPSILVAGERIEEPDPLGVRRVDVPDAELAEDVADLGSGQSVPGIPKRVGNPLYLTQSEELRFLRTHHRRYLTSITFMTSSP